MAKQTPLLSHTGAGAQSITIGWEDFIKGISTTDKVSDGGFSPNSYNINLLPQVGEISSTASPTEYVSFSGTYTGLCATCPNVDIGGVSGKAVRGITTLGDFYSGTSAGAWTTPVTDSTNTYQSGFSDMVSFNGKYYASSHNAATGDNVCSWDGVTTIVVDWFHTNFSNYLSLNCPHPMLVFNNYLYIADGNKLHRYDPLSSSPDTYHYAQLAIDSDAVITSLAIDPNSGRMMVGYCQVWQNATYPTHSNVGLYDGENPAKFVKLVPMDDIVHTMFSVGGTVYIVYGNTLGIWNGAGVTFLRTLASGSFTHKQTIMNIGNDIYFHDNGYIYCYTELKGLDKKVFFTFYKNVTGQNLQTLFNLNNKSLISFSNIDGSNLYHLWKLDVSAVGSQSQLGLFYSNWYYFPRPVYVRAIDFTTDGLLTSGDTMTPSINDDMGNNIAFIPGALTVSNTTQTNRMTTDTNPTTCFQFVLTMTSVKPFRRATVYYDLAE